jgi:hypothetical protein
VLKVKTTGTGFFETLLIIDKDSPRGVYRVSASYNGFVDRDLNLTFQVTDRQSDSSTAKSKPGLPTPNNSQSKKDIPNNEIKIPNWVKNNAEWWASEQIGDQAFISSIKYLIEQDIIKIPETPKTSSKNLTSMPLWVKNIAGFWSNDTISDSEFVKSIQYLIGNGIIVIS